MSQTWSGSGLSLPSSLTVILVSIVRSVYRPFPGDDWRRRVAMVDFGPTAVAARNLPSSLESPRPSTFAVYLHPAACAMPTQADAPTRNNRYKNEEPSHLPTSSR
jgi:hypothetical protein